MARPISVFGSTELGLTPGGWAELDAALVTLCRQQVVLRLVAILNLHAVLFERRPNSVFWLNKWYARRLPTDLKERVAQAGASETGVFLEPWQLLTVLKRALAGVA